MKLHIRAALAVSGAMFAMSSVALTTFANGGVSVDHTDNSRQSSVNPQSDVEQTIDAQLGANHDGNALDVAADYTIKKVYFDRQTQGDSTVTTGDAKITYEQLPQTLIWTLENSVRDVLRDKAQANIQDNRDGRSITTGGGTFNMRPFDAGDVISLGASYTDVSYNNTNGRDSSRTGGSVGWQHSLNSISDLSLSVAYSEVEFDDGRNNYDYTASTLGYRVALSKLQYDIRLGYNEQKRNTGTTNGLLVDLSALYNGAGSTWKLSAKQELTDTSIGNNNQSLSGLGQSANTSSPDVLERTSFEIKYTNSILCSSCDVSVSVLAEQERYEVFNDDNDETAAKLGISYLLTRNTSLSANVEYRDYVFKGLNLRSDYDVVRYRLGLGYSAFRDISLDFNVAYIERNSEDGLTDFDELRGGISMNYRFW